jgi:hypothetical protein
MPSIKIFEEDLTKGGGRSTNLNVVYVPGFMCANSGTDKTLDPGAFPWREKKDENGNIIKDAVGNTEWEKDLSDVAYANQPQLCETVAQFEMYFGTEPATYEKDGKMVIDKSYFYAKELIASGLPVLYESMNRVDDGQVLSEGLMYKSLLTAYDKLWDRGEYQFKYLTSGGYPTYYVDYSYVGQDIKTTLDKETAKDVGAVTVLNSFNVKGDSIISYIGKNAKGSHQWKGDNHTFTESIKDGVTTLYIDTMDEDTEVVSITPVLRFDTPVDTADFKYSRLKVDKDSTFATKLKFVDDQDSIVGQWIGTTTVATDDVVISKTKDKSIARVMAKLTTSDSTSRGDCIALLDHMDNPDMDITGNSSVYSSIRTDAKSLDGADGSAMFTPWVNMTVTTAKQTLSMPASFAYLMALAKSLRINPSWLAIAGATRGQIPNLDGDNPLHLNKVMTNAIAESLQNRNGVSINAITNIKPFGYRIWGNRTLKDNSIEGNLTATSFLNTKTMICDVKKVVWDACRKYMFEQNNDVLWLNFKSEIEPTLNKMKTGAGLSGYKIIRGTTTEKAKLVATIKLYPLYAVEDFEVTVQMLDEEIKVS